MERRHFLLSTPSFIPKYVAEYAGTRVKSKFRYFHCAIRIRRDNVTTASRRFIPNIRDLRLLPSSRRSCSYGNSIEPSRTNSIPL